MMMIVILSLSSNLDFHKDFKFTWTEPSTTTKIRLKQENALMRRLSSAGMYCSKACGVSFGVHVTGFVKRGLIHAIIYI